MVIIHIFVKYILIVLSFKTKCKYIVCEPRCNIYVNMKYQKLVWSYPKSKTHKPKYDLFRDLKPVVFSYQILKLMGHLYILETENHMTYGKNHGYI